MNIGAPEVLLIALVAFLLFGPSRLPGFARDAAKALKEFRRAAREVTDDLKTEVREAEKKEKETQAQKGA